MLNIIKKLGSLFKLYQAYSSDESKLSYLRSLGAKIGDETRFIGKPYLGTEPYLISIGKDCLVSDHVVFHTHDGGVIVLNGAGYLARISVGDNCFIGSCAHLMGGVKVGNNCIVGAMSVVTKDIPDNSVAAGIPARVICTLDDFYKRNMDRGVFYPTSKLTPQQRIAFLKREVK